MEQVSSDGKTAHTIEEIIVKATSKGMVSILMLEILVQVEGFGKMVYCKARVSMCKEVKYIAVFGTMGSLLG